MPDEAAFLDALRAQPADDTTRLVYADWLDERGDTRAAYLRQLAAVATADDFTPLLPQLVAAGAELDADWRRAVSARFEVVFRGTSQSWEPYVRRILEIEFRTHRVELAAVRQASPTVLLDCLPPDAAVDTADEWVERCARSVRDGRVPEEWFSARPMGSTRPPVPQRFEVVVAGHFDNLSSQSHQIADVFVEPLRALFGMTEDDARYLLYSSGSVPLRVGLSFAAALAETATRNKALKRHAMAPSLRELVSVDIRPEFSP